MRRAVRSVATHNIAVAAASALAFSSMALPTDMPSPPTVGSGVHFSAATVEATASPPGALIEQFLINQIENCSLICPFVIQGLVQVPLNFAVLPLTLVRLLESGQPFLRAAALSDATVSGPLNDAVTGIITNDLNLVLPRAQNALEIAVLGLIRIGTAAVLQPGDLLEAINAARTELLDALRQPPGTTPPPPVHNALEAAVVRVIEVASAVFFQAPERLLLGVTQAADALFTTVGTTGDIGAALAAVAASVSMTLNDSIGFIRHALTEPIPITAATIQAPQGTNSIAAATIATPTANTPLGMTTSAPVLINTGSQTPTTPPSVETPPAAGPNARAGGNAASAHEPSVGVARATMQPNARAGENATSAQEPSVGVPRATVRPSARAGGNADAAATSDTSRRLAPQARSDHPPSSHRAGNDRHQVTKKPPSRGSV